MTLFTLLLVGDLAVVVFALGNEIKEVWDHGVVWETGRPAEDGSMSGKVTSHNFILHSYDLNVRFTDDKHSEHTGRLRFSTLFRKIDRETPIEIHYDPANPARFAVNTVDERAGSRWMLIVLFGGMAGLVGYGLVKGFQKSLRWLAVVRRTAKSSTELAFKVISVADIVDKKGKRTGNTSYTYQRPNGSTASETFNIKPLFTDETEQFLVALVSPEDPNWPIVVRADRYPFAG